MDAAMTLGQIRKATKDLSDDIPVTFMYRDEGRADLIFTPVDIFMTSPDRVTTDGVILVGILPPEVLDADDYEDCENCEGCDGCIEDYDEYEGCAGHDEDPDPTTLN